MTVSKGINLEKTVLAAMLTNEDCALDVNLLHEDDFLSSVNRDIFDAIRNLVRKEKPVDYMTIYKELGEKIDLTYLIELTDLLPTTAHFQQYVDDLKDITLKRQVKALAAEIVEKEDTGENLIEEIEENLYNLRDGKHSDGFLSTQSLALETFADIERVQSGDVDDVVPTGFESMDKLLNGGFRKGEYILLGARPSMGKTALSLNIASNMLKDNKTVAYFSMEMPSRTLQKRLIAGISHVNMGKLMHHNLKLTADEWQDVTLATNFIAGSNLHVTDDPTLTVAQIQSMSRKLKRTKGLDIVIIDYLQRVNSTVTHDRRLAIEQISRDLKSMASILDIPVVVITSLSRGNEIRSDKRPQLTDLRETGQLEFDADVVIFLHRENYYDPDAPAADAEAIFAKNRNGQLGIAELIWKAEYTSFFNKARGY